ncbi:MAG: hypothetical protein A2X04_07120 [Bacteroidetes bacterium GWF2_41_9]|nr:MAG: hypothetical protein A2X04_07120 [Bacteroidetes bacterium GWF2_41_9]HBH82900.1 hypothetical protein [Bacteroidales bacterium]
MQRVKSLSETYGRIIKTDLDIVPSNLIIMTIGNDTYKIQKRLKIIEVICMIPDTHFDYKCFILIFQSIKKALKSLKLSAFSSF